MNNSPFLGRFKVKATTATKAFPPLKSALDMAFNATAVTVLLGCLHSYFRHDGFVEQGIVTLILFAIGAYVAYFISWYF